MKTLQYSYFECHHWACELVLSFISFATILMKLAMHMRSFQVIAHCLSYDVVRSFQGTMEDLATKV